MKSLSATHTHGIEKCMERFFRYLFMSKISFLFFFLPPPLDVVVLIAFAVSIYRLSTT